MERGRIAEVHAGAYGTGYLVAPRLVLTALHLITDSQQIKVRFLDGDDDFPADLVWSGSGQLDAALIRLDRVPSAPKEPARWGRLVSSLGGVPAEAAGFSAAQRLPDGKRGLDHLVGTLDPLAGAPHHVEFELAGPLPTLDSPWNGSSGGPITCHGLLTAILVRDLRSYGHRRLPALPVEQCWADPAFRRTLHAVGGRTQALEPIELAPILSVPSRLASAPTSAASLLRAEAEVVRFVGRSAELGRLTEWCQGEGFAVRLLMGPGGRGKSRLAHKLVHTMEDQGWAAGHVVDGAGIKPVADHLGALTAPTLLVVDYVESRPGQAMSLVAAVARHRGGHPARVLLVARTRGEWWEQLATTAPRELRDILCCAPVDEVPAYAPSDRRQLFDDAVEDLRDRLTDPTAETVVAPDLSDDRYGSPLLIGMAALAGLLSGERLVASAPDIILRHERPYWSAVADRYEVHLQQRDLRKVIAAFSLCGAANEAEALDLLARLPGFADQSDDGHQRRQRAISWLRDLYPPVSTDAEDGSGGAFCGSLQPDQLAEYLIAEVVRENPGFLARVLAEPSAGQAKRALTVLCRAASHQSDLGAVIVELLERQTHLVEYAADVVSVVENPAPLYAALK